MKTKLMKSLLAVACLLSSIGASAYDFTVDGIYYNATSVTDMTCSVTSGDVEYAGDITIPANVTYNNRTLAVTSIGSSAFNGCSRLTGVTIPNSVTSIGGAAFLDCSRLTNITIPNSVTSIGNSAFLNCSGLTSMTIPNSVTSIENYAFKNCFGLTSITIPNSVTSIGYSAFDFCLNMKSLIIDDGEKTLELGNGYSDLFYSSPLKYVYIGRNLNYATGNPYGYRPFHECRESITEITFGKYITEIPQYTKDFSKLETITLYNPTPPNVSSDYFTNAQYMNLNVYVPKGSLEVYQHANVWKTFWNLQEKDLAGIETVVADDCNTDNVIYDMQGRRLDAPKAGLNIINGKKVMIRK